MKKTITLALIFASLTLGAKTVTTIETAASDPRVTWIGRTLAAQDGSVSFDWSATSARIAFEGDYLAVKVSDTKKNYFNVWLDKEPTEEADFVIKTQGNDSLIVLARNLKKGVHKVTVQKRTEGEQGTTTLHSIFTHGNLVQAEPLKARIIEIVGDSYTCGYGSENSVAKDPFTPETENINKAYDAIIARYFGADLVAIAHSGMGITRNYNEEKKPHLYGYHMPDRYLQTFDENKEIKWDAKAQSWKPSITIIYLGANDFSVGKQPSLKSYKAKYNVLLKQIKENYGEDHPILCCATKNDELIFDYVREVALNCGLKNVRYTGIFHGVQKYDDTELGASSHPNYKAQIKTAYTIIPYVSTLTGWDMENKIVR